MEDFLVKPLSLDTMRQKVRAVIDKHLAMTSQKEDRLELEICGQLLSGSRTLGECFAQCGFPPPPEPLCMALWQRDGGQPGDWRELNGCFTWTPRSHTFLLTAWDGGQAADRLRGRRAVAAPRAAPGKEITEALRLKIACRRGFVHMRPEAVGRAEREEVARRVP